MAAIFVDSGILLRAVHRNDPHYHVIRDAVRIIVHRRTTMFTGLQQFAEFWDVSSRPPGERGGFNLPLEEVARGLRRPSRTGPAAAFRCPGLQEDVIIAARGRIVW